jgi:hypothetical protein
MTDTSFHPVKRGLGSLELWGVASAYTTLGLTEATTL